MNGQLEQWINGLKGLTPSEYETSVKNAGKLVVKDIGDEPKRESYRREVENQFKDPLFWFIIIIFFAALSITGFEVFGFVGNELQQNHVDLTYEYGFQINHQLKTAIFQIGFLLMAELMMFVTTVLWRTDVVRKHKNGYYDNKNFWGKQLDIYMDLRFFVAILSMIFIFVVNWSSGYHFLMRVMIPILSFTLGYLIEKYYSEWREEEMAITREYNKHYEQWQAVRLDPKSHSEYFQFLMRSIWQKLQQKNRNYDTDVVGEWKYLAVQREIENAEWAKYTHQTTVAIKHDDNVDENSSEIEILKSLVDNWNGKDRELRTQNYVVDMHDHRFIDRALDEIKEFSDLAGLRRSITAKVNRATKG